MSWTRIASAVGGGFSTSSVNDTLSSSVAVGDTICVGVVWDSSAGADHVTVADDLGNTYTSQVGPVPGSGGEEGQAFRCIVEHAGTPTITATARNSSETPVASGDLTMIADAFAGSDASSTGDGGTGQRASDTAGVITSGGITTTENGDLLWSCCFDASTGSETFDPGSGWTEGVSASDTAPNGFSFQSEYQVQSSAGGIAGTWAAETPGTGASFIALVMAITHAAPPPPPTLTAYTSDFSVAENPLSESGVWLNGGRTGGDWHDVQTTGGIACGATEVSGFTDCLAVLYGAIDADQYVESVVSRASGYDPSVSHEVEQLLRFTISSGTAAGYEVLWGHAGNLNIVRWNGDLGDFTALLETDLDIGAAVDGDVLRSEISGGTITVRKNGSVVATATDATYATGQPGIGFWPTIGSTPSSYGWTSVDMGPLSPAPDVSTTFDATENPISESSAWVNGGTTGLDWQDVQTGSGVAYGTGLSSTPDDNLAHRTGTWDTVQAAEAIVHLASGYAPPDTHEAELLLNFSISAHDAHGYEITWPLGGTLQVVRWNGDFNDFTVIDSASIGAPSDGDVLRAERVAGDLIEVSVNGTLVLTADLTSEGGTVHTGGAPGMGFFARAGSTLASYGWTSWRAWGKQTDTELTLGVGAVTAAGVAPALDITHDTFLTLGAGAAAAAGLAPTLEVTADQVRTLGVGTATAAGLAPSLDATGDQHVTLGVGSVTAAGLEPSLDLTADVFLDLGLGAAVAAGLAPTLDLTADQHLTLGLGAVAAAGLAPGVTVTADIFKDLGAGAASAAGLALELEVTGDQHLALGIGSVTTTGHAATIAQTGGAEPAAALTGTLALGPRLAGVLTLTSQLGATLTLTPRLTATMTLTPFAMRTVS